jgi:hypothetical protein
MLNLVESSDALQAYANAMELIGFLIHHYQNKELLDLPLGWQLLEILPLRRYNLEIIFSLLSIK